jgi:hypothetical protein
MDLGYRLINSFITDFIHSPVHHLILIMISGFWEGSMERAITAEIYRFSS